MSFSIANPITVSFSQFSVNTYGSTKTVMLSIVFNLNEHFNHKLLEEFVPHLNPSLVKSITYIQLNVSITLTNKITHETVRKFEIDKSFSGKKIYTKTLVATDSLMYLALNTLKQKNLEINPKGLNRLIFDYRFTHERINDEADKVLNAVKFNS